MSHFDISFWYEIVPVSKRNEITIFHFTFLDKNTMKTIIIRFYM